MSAGQSAVLLEGAKRIGKSTIVEEFAKNEYDDYLILDFARESYEEDLAKYDEEIRKKHQLYIALYQSS